MNPDKPPRRSFTVTSNWREQSPLFCPRPFSQEGAALHSGPVFRLGNMASPSVEGSMTHSSGAPCFMSRRMHHTTVCVCVLLEDDTLSHAAATFTVDLIIVFFFLLLLGFSFIPSSSPSSSLLC